MGRVAGEKRREEGKEDEAWDINKERRPSLFTTLFVYHGRLFAPQASPLSTNIFCHLPVLSFCPFTCLFTSLFTRLLSLGGKRTWGEDNCYEIFPHEAIPMLVP